MKRKINLIIILSILLICLTTLLCVGVGTSSKNTLAEDEMAAYNNRKTYSALTTQNQKASYVVGMSFRYLASGLADKDEEFFAKLYSISSNPESPYYYSGQLNTPSTPLNLKDWGANVDMRLNEDCFVAGYAQTMEDKVLNPELSGDKGLNYLQKISSELSTIDTETIVEDVAADSTEIKEVSEIENN